MVDITPPGVYFGYARVSARRSDDQVDGPSSGTLDEGQTKVYPMVMSLGWNPFYRNKKLTAVRRITISSYPSLKTCLV
jgi:riboflavin kinase